MKYIDLSFGEFIERLASADAVPGGGGAAAAAGALGAALGSMVANLTVNKKKYVSVKEEMERLIDSCGKLSRELAALADADAESFAPLAAAYGLPAGTEEEKARKAEVISKASEDACQVPFAVMEKAMEALKLHQRLAEAGSRMVISDVGVGAALCRAALQSAALNVYINTKSFTDRARAEEADRMADALTAEGSRMADGIYSAVSEALRRKGE